ncbi:hypothetical protein CIT292_10308 [Citrobacter youngae ATCC 29220]|uniref:Uncharacterized protein n=1 Tax=Citrobacter youngae ATCC 29220 TaxID=500640 RepID=D4BIE3_9ENTR|nr:hypothetical protein CIT292_10308 [Citrobacter youngae ATCC 29220]
MVNYIKTTFHYFFEPARVLRCFCRSVFILLGAERKVLRLSADNL